MKYNDVSGRYIALSSTIVSMIFRGIRILIKNDNNNATFTSENNSKKKKYAPHHVPYRVILINPYTEKDNKYLGMKIYFCI